MMNMANNECETKEWQDSISVETEQAIYYLRTWEWHESRCSSE